MVKAAQAWMDQPHLTPIIHDEWIMRAVLVTYLNKPLHTQKHPPFGFRSGPGL